MARITMTFYEMMNCDVNFTAITAQVFETANPDSEPVVLTRGLRSKHKKINNFL